MNIVHLLLRRFSLTLAGFLILALAIFFFWRSFSDSVLTQMLINPHSEVPRQVQIELAKTYLGINVPVYFQYFTFLENIVTGKWAYLLPSISYTVFNTILLMALSLLLGPVFLDIMGRIRIHRTPVKNRRIPIYAVAAVILSITIPLLIRYVLLILGAQHFLEAAFPEQATNLPWINDLLAFYAIPAQVTSPTHVLLIDSLLNGNPGYSYYFLVHLLPEIFSTALVLAAVMQLMKSAALPGNPNPQKGTLLSGKPGTPSKEQEISVRRHFLSRAAFLLFLTEIITIYSEVLFSYKPGLGYYLSKFFNYSPGFSLNTAEIWPLSYSILTLGIVLIIGSLLSGIYHDLTVGRTKNL